MFDLNSMDQRFINKVNLSDECWLWNASLNNFGYARYKIDGKMVLAHRYAYKYFNGDIPKGFELDHICRVRHCVNPAHLEAVTHLDNVRRGKSGEHGKVKTHCPQGHEYTDSNTVMVQRGRRCRTCQNDRSRLYREKIRRETYENTIKA